MRFHGIVAFGLLAVPLVWGEQVVFTSGQMVHADRHERRGDRMLLYRGGGVMDLPVTVVAGFVSDSPAAVDAPVSAAPAPVAGLPAVAAPVAQPPDPLANDPLANDPLANDPRAMVRAAAERAGLPPKFVESVALVESAFQPDAVSPKGAIGVMQLMPDTARTLGADPHDVQQNIDAGTRLLRQLLLKYDGDVVKALAAYNAGEGAVARYNGLPPYTETRQYVNRVIGAYQKDAPQVPATPGASK